VGGFKPDWCLQVLCMAKRVNHKKGKAGSKKPNDMERFSTRANEMFNIKRTAHSKPEV
jgi:hypothetical protein